MINNPTAIAKYKIQEGVAEYPIGFKYSDNADGTPQLKVSINGSEATYGEHWVLSLDRKSVIVLEPEQVGAHLTIVRSIPFVQESDYQVGRIDPEQIESDFDASVERDQQLDEQHNALVDRVARDEEQIDQNAQDIEALQAEQLEQDARIAQAQSTASQAVSTAEKAVTTANQADTKADKANTTAGEAKSLADSAVNTAVTAKSLAETAVDTANTAVAKTTSALSTAASAEAKAESALNTAGAALGNIQTALDSARSAEGKAESAAAAAAQATQAANEAKAGLAGKQDKLTAGKNITIVGNEISAEGGSEYVEVDAGKNSMGISDKAWTAMRSTNSFAAGWDASVSLDEDGMTAVGASAKVAAGGMTVVGAKSYGYAENGTGIGSNVYVGGIGSKNVIAIGHGVRGTDSNSITIGTDWTGGLNSKGEGTFTVGLGEEGYVLMKADGFIPSGRLATGGVIGQYLALTANGMEWKTVEGGGTGDLSAYLKKTEAEETYATKQSVKDSITAERSVSDGKYLTIADSKAFALKTALDSTDKMVEQHTQEISDVMGDVAALGIDKQDKLTAGDNITIEDGVISATGGGGDFVDNAKYNVVIGGTSSAGFLQNVVVGVDAETTDTQCVSIGYNSHAQYNGVAVGANARSNNGSAVQIGAGENFESGTVQFYNWRMLDSEGHIPAERLADNGSVGQVLSKTASGMEWKTVEGGALPDNVLVNNATGYASLAIGNNATATATMSLAVGTSATASGGSSTAVGRGISIYNSGGDSVAVGTQIQIQAEGVVALGRNMQIFDPHTFWVSLGYGEQYKYQMLNADGLIPSARFAGDGIDGQVLVKNGDYAEWKTVEGGGELPDNVVTNVANNTEYNIAIGNGANCGGSPFSICIGTYSTVYTPYTTCIGGQAQALSASSIALGHLARIPSDTDYAIQIGRGENDEAHTLKIGLDETANYTLLDADGHIPDERLPQLGDIQTALTAILGE